MPSFWEELGGMGAPGGNMEELIKALASMGQGGGNQGGGGGNAWGDGGSYWQGQGQSQQGTPSAGTPQAQPYMAGLEAHSTNKYEGYGQRAQMPPQIMQYLMMLIQALGGRRGN